VQPITNGKKLPWGGESFKRFKDSRKPIKVPGSSRIKKPEKTRGKKK